MKPIPKCRGYFATMDGRIFSEKSGHPRELRVEITRTGNARVTFSNRGRTKRHLVSHLVMVTFDGPIPRGAWVLHRDGDGANNRLANLFIGRRREERANAVAISTVAHGVRASKAKLTPLKVRAIRRLLAMKVAHREIAARYGVSRPAIGMIARGRSWIRVPHERLGAA